MTNQSRKGAILKKKNLQHFAAYLLYKVMKMLHIGVCYHIWEMGQFYMTNQSKKDAYLYKKNFAAYCCILQYTATYLLHTNFFT